jgi:hypothetical protein
MSQTRKTPHQNATKVFDADAGRDIDLEYELDETETLAEDWTAEEEAEYQRSKQQGQAEGNPAPPSADAHVRPEVEVLDRDLNELTHEVLQILEDANNPPVIYCRDGVLVRVRTGNGIERPTIKELTEATLRARMVEVAQFGYWHITKKEQTWVPRVPSRELVQNILAQSDWHFPTLTGIIEAPCIRPDGTILNTPGYDVATKLLYIPAADLNVPAIPDHPTQKEVDTARGVIDEAIREFPFDCQASRANTFALLLTAVARPAISGLVPAAVVTSPEAGTGKTTLTELVPAIVTGRDPSKLGAAKSDEEWSKRITSVLLHGPSFALIDNVSGKLQSPELDRLLTSLVWEDRVLGGNKIASLPNTAAWMVTGNNVQLGGDTPRRCYRIHLDAKMPQPWKRTGFMHDPLIPWVKAHRSEMLSALLTIVRAWYAGGMPEHPTPTKGSYSAWARTIGSTLAHAGIQGFLENEEKLYEDSDPERPQWATFFLAWHEAYGSTAVTAKQVANEAAMGIQKQLKDAWPEELATALMDPNKAVKSMGKALASQKDRRYELTDGRVVRMEKAGVDRKESILWRVMVEAPQDPLADDLPDLDLDFDLGAAA